MNPVWSQQYTVFGQGLAVSALVAAVPIATLLFLLAVRRKAAWVAGLWALGATMVVALVAYHMPLSLAISSAAYGAAFGLLPISWIVFWAIALYEITVESGKFEIIQASVGSLTSDRRMQALLIAFAFGAFVEGAAGFGTPVAVAAAMMVGLGFDPFFAAALCLLANTAPVAFGSIGIPVVTLAGITGLPLGHLSAAVGRLCAPMSLILPGYLVLTMAGWSGVLEVLPAVVVVGGVFSTVQFLMSTHVGPQLADILSSLAALVSLLVLLRLWRPSARYETVFEMAPVAATAGGGAGIRDGREEAPLPSKALRRYGAGEVVAAWMPYGLLVIFVLVWGFKPFQAVLNSVTIIFAWPALHNLILRMPPVVANPTPYAASYTMDWLSASGTSCMFATLAAALLMRMSPRSFGRVLVTVTKQLFLPIVTIAVVLAMAFVMNYCGATATLGLTFAEAGALFPFFSPVLGWLGVFLTGSDTASNALFGSLQVVTAGRLGFDPMLMAAANSVGGVMGKMVSVQNIAVAAAATGISVSDQARLFRFTLRHGILLVGLVGVEVVLYAYVFH